MTQPTLKDKLSALKAGPNSVYIRRLAQVLPEIEAALARGVTRTAVVQALQEDGINLTLDGLAKALYRLRKRSREANEHSAFVPGTIAAAAQPTPATQQPTPAALPPGPAPAKPFDPADIRAIARSRPDLNELTRLGREAAAKAKSKPT